MPRKSRYVCRCGGVSAAYRDKAIVPHFFATSACKKHAHEARICVLHAAPFLVLSHDDMFSTHFRQSTLAPPAVGGRSRALATQYKLDQLEKQREIQKEKRKAKMGGGSLLMASKNETGGGGGLRMAAFDDDDDDDDDNSDNDTPAMQIRDINDRGSSVTMLGAGKRNPELGNAAKKLEMLGLSDEVDHSEAKAGAAVPTAAPTPSSDGGKEEEREEEEESSNPSVPMDVSDVKTFVMTTIPKSQSGPVQCYIKRVRSGLQKLWPYYVLYSQVCLSVLVCAQGLCRFSLYTCTKVRMRALDAALGLLCTVALYCGFVGARAHRIPTSSSSPAVG